MRPPINTTRSDGQMDKAQRATDHPTDQRFSGPGDDIPSQLQGFSRSSTRRERIEAVKAQLLPPSERAQLEAQLGKLVGPLIDAKLEAKAIEMLDRYQKAWMRTFQDFWRDVVEHGDALLVTREDAAKLLGVSLSTIKRMEKSGELPEPMSFGERTVRHKQSDIEAFAKTRQAVWRD